MFSVRHHDDEVTVFNSKCHNVVLVNHIRKTLGVNGAIDLIAQQSDYKTAAPVGLLEKGDTVYANNHITFRGHYLLLQVTEDEEANKEYTLLWKSKTTDEADRVTMALETRLADERKKAGGKTGKKGK